MNSNAKGFVGLAVLGMLVATAVNAASYTTPIQSTMPHGDASWTPVAVELPSDANVIVVSETVITERRAHTAPSRAITYQAPGCAFQFRPVVQGPAGASVRGFCQ